MKLIRLGSYSTTRAGILKAYNIEFVQNGSDFDEDSIKNEDPKSFVYQAALGKYYDCLQKYGFDIPLLVADTVVTSGGKLLRKAKDKEDAKRMLELQSGSEATIITCMIFKKRELELIDISAATYQFSEFDKKDMQKYIDSGECMGKAGAIMVEGFCKPYIKSVQGYESCAMGLTIEKLLPFL